MCSTSNVINYSPIGGKYAIMLYGQGNLTWPKSLVQGELFKLFAPQGEVDRKVDNCDIT